MAKLDINQASREELASLEGINEQRANLIVEYREAEGPFESWDELREVEGIGEALTETIRAQCTMSSQARGSSSAQQQRGSGSARALVDHDAIRQWTEERGGCPARVAATGGDGDVGIIRIDFPGYSGKKTLEPIEWEQFFAKFEERGLALLVRDQDRFNKLVSRDSVDVAEQEPIDAVAMLMNQHRVVERLFQEMSEASGRQKAELFEELAEMMALHAAVEEEIFYPELRSEDNESQMLYAAEEHLVVKRTLADMFELEVGDPRFDAKALLVEELFAAHLEEEEEEILPAARERFGAERLVELADEMMSRMAELENEDLVQRTRAEAEQVALT